MSATNVPPRAPIRLRHRRGSRRGIALIVVLGAVTVLTVMMTELQDEAASEINVSLANRDLIKAEYAARSGLNLARLLIAAEPSIRAALTPMFMLFMRGKPPPQLPVWEYAPQILGAFGDAESAATFARTANVDLSQGKNLGLDGAAFELTIVNEDGKLNVNEGARANAFAQERFGAQLLGLIGAPQYDELFSARDADGRTHTRQDVCSAIVDWTDPDTDHFPCDPRSTGQAQTSTGAEDGYYDLLKKPYKRKNGAMDSLDELRRVRGVDDRFWSTFVDPNPDDPNARVVTVWGQGTLNVNTANPQTILALLCSPRITVVETSPVCIDPMQTSAFVSALGLARSFTMGLPMFSSPKHFVRAVQGQGSAAMMFQALNIPPFQLRSPQMLESEISTEAKVFSVYSTGRVQQAKRELTVRVHAVVDFRGAPPPDATRMKQAQDVLTRGKGALPGQALPPPTPSASADPMQELGLAALFRPDPGGTLLYYRLE